MNYVSLKGEDGEVLHERGPSDMTVTMTDQMTAPHAIRATQSDNEFIEFSGHNHSDSTNVHPLAHQNMLPPGIVPSI